MRLQKYLASQGLCSRSQGEALISQGRICVNSKVAVIGDRVSGEEEITFDGRVVEQQGSAEKKVLLFHKPVGVESSMNKVVGGVTLANYDFGEERVFPIGHLDTNVHGVLLLTNDGELANKLSGRKKGLVQEYTLVFETAVKEDVAEKLLTELQKHGDDNVLSVSAKEHDENALVVRTRILRSKDIRRVAENYKNGLVDVCRHSVGPISLADLVESKIVTLSQKDYEHLVMLASIAP